MRWPKWLRRLRPFKPQVPSAPCERVEQAKVDFEHQSIRLRAAALDQVDSAERSRKHALAAQERVKAVRDRTGVQREKALERRQSVRDLAQGVLQSFDPAAEKGGHRAP